MYGPEYQTKFGGCRGVHAHPLTTTLKKIPGRGGASYCTAQGCLRRELKKFFRQSSVSCRPARQRLEQYMNNIKTYSSTILASHNLQYHRIMVLVQSTTIGSEVATTKEESPETHSKKPDGRKSIPEFQRLTSIFDLFDVSLEAPLLRGSTKTRRWSSFIALSDFDSSRWIT